VWLDQLVQPVHKVVLDLEVSREALVSADLLVLKVVQDGLVLLDSKASPVILVAVDLLVLLVQRVLQASQALLDKLAHQVSTDFTLVW